MKFEKRTDGEQIPSSPQEDKPSAGRKPVVIYIMILFIVAFLLMALSFVMHQRSNSEVLGELQNSVSAAINARTSARLSSAPGVPPVNALRQTSSSDSSVSTSRLPDSGTH